MINTSLKDMHKRWKITISSLESWKKGQDYLSMSHLERSRYIPLPREGIPNPSSFLAAIGRSMDQHSSKFPNWSDLFTFSSSKLSVLGLKVSDRKYLQSCREWYKRGMNLPKALIKSRPNRRKSK